MSVLRYALSMIHQLETEAAHVIFAILLYSVLSVQLFAEILPLYSEKGNKLQ